MALMQIAVVPIGTSSPSIGDYVADAVRLAKESGLAWQLDEFGTVVEGSVEELLRLATRMHSGAFSKGAQRVTTSIELDERRDKEVHLGGKSQAVKNRLG
jgi:uncharacterized protein (TIGR00106 family)